MEALSHHTDWVIKDNPLRTCEYFSWRNRTCVERINALVTSNPAAGTSHVHYSIRNAAIDCTKMHGANVCRDGTQGLSITLGSHGRDRSRVTLAGRLLLPRIPRPWVGGPPVCTGVPARKRRPRLRRAQFSDTQTQAQRGQADVSRGLCSPSSRPGRALGRRG